jgi:hypothetical protein
MQLLDILLEVQVVGQCLGGNRDGNNNNNNHA